MLANTTKTAKPQWFGINLFPLSAKTFFHLQWPPFVESLRYTVGRQVAGESPEAESLPIKLLGCHLHLLPWLWLEEWMEGWENGWDHWDSVSFQLQWTVWSWGNQRVIQGSALFSMPFFCPVITDNYGYQVAISGLHAFRLIWLEKFASLLEISLKPDRYCWRMMVRVIPICSICLNGKIHRCKNSPLMAGGGDSVPRVILLSFPQTGAGCRFEALISMFQQAWDKHKLFRWWRQSYSCLKITVEEKLLPAASGHPELNDFVNYNFHEETDS